MDHKDMDRVRAAWMSVGSLEASVDGCLTLPRDEDGYAGVVMEPGEVALTFDAADMIAQVWAAVPEIMQAWYEERAEARRLRELMSAFVSCGSHGFRVEVATRPARVIVTGPQAFEERIAQMVRDEIVRAVDLTQQARIAELSARVKELERARD